MNLMDKRILGDSSDEAPAVVAHAGGLVMAWRGSGNDQLNVMVSENGIDFVVATRTPSTTPAIWLRPWLRIKVGCSSPGRDRATTTSTSRSWCQTPSPAACP